MRRELPYLVFVISSQATHFFIYSTHAQTSSYHSKLLEIHENVFAFWREAYGESA
jgi:hypothetical protein